MMRRIRFGLFAAVLVSAVFLAGRVSADGEVPTGMWLRNNEGEIFMLANNGILVPIAVIQVSDEQLAGYQLAPFWIVTQNGQSTSGPRPDWASGPLTPAPASAQPSGWQKVAQWSGNGSKTTEPFTISGSQWRIQSTAKNDRGFSQLCISTKRIADGRLTSAGCTNGGGESYGTAGTSGAMQMEISGVNGGWSVTVEELR